VHDHQSPSTFPERFSCRSVVLPAIISIANPTSGFLVYVPDSQLSQPEMSVADAIKSIISLDSLSAEYSAGRSIPVTPQL
jgi:uncharacterized membrane protein